MIESLAHDIAHKILSLIPKKENGDADILQYGIECIINTLLP